MLDISSDCFAWERNSLKCVPRFKLMNLTMFIDQKAGFFAYYAHGVCKEAVCKETEWQKTM